MGTKISDAPVAEPQPQRRTRPRWRIVVTAVAVTVLALAAIVLVDLIRTTSWHQPSFPVLTEHPDSALQGTIAYVDSDTRCVRIAAASGAASKDVLCLPTMDVSKALTDGKEIGPQLVWRPDGRLEITMFRFFPVKGPIVYRPDWQKIVDVRTGTVVNVPAAQVPSEPNTTSHALVSPTGQRIGLTSSNHAKITLTDSSGTRTLLSVNAPEVAQYTISTAFWAPGFRWIAASDGRILVITPGPPAKVRLLNGKEDPGVFGRDDSRLSSFAVTSADLFGG